MKRPNLQITGLEEGEESQVKDTDNIFKQNVEEFPQPKGADAYQAVGEYARHQMDQTRKDTPQHTQ